MAKSRRLQTGRLTPWGALSVGLLALGCSQPEPRCSIARGDFAATYTLLSSTGPCEPLRGELLSVQAYTARRSVSDPRPDYDKSSMAIQPRSLTALLEPARGAENGEDKPYAMGAFATSRPASDDFCSVPSLSTARLRLPEGAAPVYACTSAAPSPAVDIAYAFSNVRVYTTPGAYGTQFAGDLTYTNGACVAQYRVAALYPAVSCAAPPAPPAPPVEPPDASAAPALGGLDAGLDGGLAPLEAGSVAPEASAGDGGCEAPPAEEPPLRDESLCAALPDPAQGRAFGSGINPDFSVQCDPELLLCVLAAPPPSLR